MKRILILGENSYIGCSFVSYAMQNYPGDFEISRISVRDEEWKKSDWSIYDTILNVAAKVHITKTNFDECEIEEYYRVNCELACETAKKAIADGVSQYIFFSSMSVYDIGDGSEDVIITAETMPSPKSPYGNSKWQAEQQLNKMFQGEKKSRLAVLRPPMIYGKGCKGNYQTLAKLAKKLPVFPDYSNQRSMLFIDTLSEFLIKLVESQQGGIFFPQDREYVKTADMVALIGDVCGKKVWKSKILNPAVVIGMHIPGKIGQLTRKAFGSLVYEKQQEIEVLGNYQKYSLQESIRLTED